MAQVVIFTDSLAVGWGRSAGAYRLATQLRSAGYSTQIVDFYSFYTRDDISKILDNWVTDETILVGVSAIFLNDMYEDVNRDGFVRRQLPLRWRKGDPHVVAEIDFMNFLFSESKRRSPHCKTAVGAGLAENLLEIELPGDYFVLGFADRAILEIVRHIKDPAHALVAFGESPKVVYADRHYSFDHFDESQIAYEKSDGVFPGEVLPMEFSRGCIFKCAFCEFPGVGKSKGSFQKTAATLRAELIENYERHRVTDYMFMDNLVNDNIDKMRVLHGVITSLPFKVRWHSFSRIDTYARSPEMITLAKEMGCVSQYFGVETFSASARKKMGKGLSPETDIETMHKLREAIGPELSISIGLIVGLPGETYDEMEKTVEWLLSGKAPVDAWSIGPLYLDRGGTAPFSLNPEKYGLRFPDANDSEFWEHDITNAREAKIRAFEFHHRTSGKNRVGGYSLFRLMNLGYEFDEIKSMSISDVAALKGEFLKRTLAVKNRYLSNLLASSNNTDGMTVGRSSPLTSPLSVNL